MESAPVDVHDFLSVQLSAAHLGHVWRGLSSLGNGPVRVSFDQPVATRTQRASFLLSHFAVTFLESFHTNCLGLRHPEDCRRIFRAPFFDPSPPRSSCRLGVGEKPFAFKSILPVHDCLLSAGGQCSDKRFATAALVHCLRSPLRIVTLVSTQRDHAAARSLASRYLSS